MPVEVYMWKEVVVLNQETTKLKESFKYSVQLYIENDQ